MKLRNKIKLELGQQRVFSTVDSVLRLVRLVGLGLGLVGLAVWLRSGLALNKHCCN